MSAARELAAWGLALRLDDVPEAARAAAKRHLLDGAGCAVAAARRGAAPFVDALLGEPGASSVVGAGRTTSLERAALATGALVHALDFDDTHAGALVHPTAVVLPVAFAVGEAVAATGAEALTAAIAGYETIVRIGEAVPHGFHARGFHATSVCGVFAAALVAARLRGLGLDATTNALGIAGSLAAGSLAFLETGAATKMLHPGFAAANGILAAQLAAAGAQGPDSIFEGPRGLFDAYLGERVEARALTDSIGERWETASITIKPYPACQLSHASLDALRALLPLPPEDVERIEFALPQGAAAIVAGKPEPRTEYEAKFSLEHCAAMLVLDGDVRVGSFDEPSRARASELSSRVGWVARPDDGPPARAPGIVAVTLRDGTRREARADASRGGPQAPMSDDEVAAKARANGLDERQLDALRSFDELPDLAAVLA